MAGKLGAKIYRSREWKIIRRQIFERDGWRCVSCGKVGKFGMRPYNREIIKSKDWFDEKNLQSSLPWLPYSSESRKERKIREAKTEKRRKFIEISGGNITCRNLTDYSY